MSALLRSTTALATMAARRCGRYAAKFTRDESGVLAAPTLIFLLFMIAFGGLGIDLMRMERDRTNLQYTLDRAVLAAADMEQELEPAAVVQDYLAKAGLEDYTSTTTHDTGLGYRWVESTISGTFEAQYQVQDTGDANTSLFNQLFSLGDIPIGANARAQESIDGVEISMVLDVSGSMNSNNRLVNLKSAAQDFVTTMSENTTDGKMSISIVPYATQVSAPAALMDLYNITDEHRYSHCVNFSASDFQEPGISMTDELERTMHFSPWNSYDYRTRYSTPRLVNTPVCEDDYRREMLLFQKDPDTLNSFISNLWGGGNTSIDIGMKWGTALLDPSAQPAVAALSSGTNAPISTDFSARPTLYTDSNTLKIIVLMTDGQNTSQYYVEDDHRRGNSDVWFNDQKNRYSLYVPKYEQFYWDGYGSWKNHAYGNGTGEDGTAEQLSYADLWAYTSLKYVYKNLYGDWMGTNKAKNEWYYGVYDYYGNSTKNTRTRTICQTAKDQGILVYTIGFEAPSDGQAVLQDCASSDAHYFDVQGLEISDAFASIATSIRQLRLTQ